MSDTVSQIQASFHPAEDRILLNIKTVNEHVYLAWITRRFMKLLIPVLHGQHPSTGKSLFEQKKSLVHQAKKEVNQLQGDFETAYSKPVNPKYPLGEAPILLAKMTFKDVQGDNGSLVLEPEQGQGIVLPYNPELLGPLIKIFSKALVSTDWALEIDPILNVPEKAHLH